MPGMNTGLNANDPAVIAAFKAVLLHQGLIALLIFGTLGLAWVSIRAWLQAGAAAVWIQAGIGIWMLAAVRGPLSRLAGLASAAWGLVVWVFGESFGGIFAPGLTWLFGAPGAVLIYVVAGALIALPERYWRTPPLGRVVLAVM